MKILHCADLHLDSKMSANLSVKAASDRNIELINTLKRLVDYANDNGAEAILISGDLFDTGVVRHRTKEFIRGLVEKNPHIQFFSLRGNHDRAVDLGIQLDNFKTFTDSWKYYTLGNVVIAGIELDKYNSYNFHNTLQLESNNINIVMLHGEINRNPGEERIVLDTIVNRSIDYLALGHIHDHSYGEIDGRGTWVYSGCLEGRGFDECGPKGFVELDILDKTIQWRFVPFQYRKLESIDIDISGIANMVELVSKVESDVSNLDSNSIVRVVLTGEYELTLRKDLRILASSLSNRFYAVKIIDKSRLFIDKSKYEYDVSLKGELIRLIKSDDTLSDEEKDLMIVLGIQALSGEELSI